jgi:hypothetical protein
MNLKRLTMSEDTNRNIEREEDLAFHASTKPTTGQQIILTMKLLCMMGLIAGLLWILNWIRVT